MAKRNRHKRPSARGRFRGESPTKTVITPDYQSSIPFEQRHKTQVLRYSNGEIKYRKLKKPRIGIPLKSNMVKVMDLAFYKRSPFAIDEILRQRFRIINMNDDWRGWDKDRWMKKQIAKRRDRLRSQRTVILSGLPSITPKSMKSEN